MSCCPRARLGATLEAMIDAPRPIQALGEIALRVRDLETMRAFYQDVIGLKFSKRFAIAVFFELAPGYEGHTQVLALFDRSAQGGYTAPEAAATSVDHIAFTIALEDYGPEKTRLESPGLEVATAVHDWVQWRSLYVNDPEGNLVELVCFDESIPKPSA